MLVIAAHPDDEVLGAGGTIAWLAAKGHDVSVLILGEGATSRGDAPREQVAALRESGQKAAQILGANDIFFESLPDNAFDSVPMLQVVKIIEIYKARLNPGKVFTHYAGDLNIDHRITCEAVLTAFRGLPGEACRRIMSFWVPSSSEWGTPRNPDAFRPNHFVNIAEHLDRKLEAMACYESEARAFPHPRSPEALRATAQFWGTWCGLHAAEPFVILRDVVT